MSIDTTLPDNPRTTEHDNDHPDGDNQPATDRTATAADHLWAALHARPGGTAEELSTDAGIGRSTAAKILARWVADGTAVRVPTDGKRSASRFAIPTPDDSAPGDSRDGAATVQGDPHATPPADPVDVDSVIDAATAPDGDPSGATDPVRDVDCPKATADDGSDHEPANAGATDRLPGAPDEARDVEPDTATTDPTPDPVPTAPEPAHDPSAAAVTSADGADDGGDSTDGTDDGARAVTTDRGPRLAPGALHGMVEDYLRDHPDEEFGPTKIGHELGRSTGAVGNALERLVTAGYAVRTNDRPKRYALATSATADPDAAGDSGA